MVMVVMFKSARGWCALIWRPAVEPFGKRPLLSNRLEQCNKGDFDSFRDYNRQDLNRRYCLACSFFEEGGGAGGEV